MLGKESYKVNIQNFQGPLDILLSLIENRKMHISEISLSEIADDYINYLEKLETFSIKASADFILIATILMLIKSKSLLPDLDLSREEEQSIEILEKRLQEYQKIKILSKNIEKIFAKNIIFFRQRFKKDLTVVFNPGKQIQINNLLSLAKNLIDKVPHSTEKKEVKINKKISLEDVITDLNKRVRKALKTSFNSYSGLNKQGNFSKKERVQIVVSFLAMLELVKQGSINVQQRESFADIDINTQELDVPIYI